MDYVFGSDKDKEDLRNLLVGEPPIGQLRHCNGCEKDPCVARQKKGSCRAVVFKGVTIRAPIPRIGKDPLIYSMASGFTNVLMTSEIMTEICTEAISKNAVRMKRMYDDE